MSFSIQPEFADNTEARLPVVLVLDTSASMKGARIDELQTGLERLIVELKNDEQASSSIEIAIITFGGEKARKRQDFAGVDAISVPKLFARGKSPMGEALFMALDMIEHRKKIYRANGIAYKLPWVMLLSDGEPSDQYHHITPILRDAIEHNKVHFQAIGVTDSCMDTLNFISLPNRAAFLGDYSFEDVFLWLSNSLSPASRGVRGVNLVALTEKHWKSIAEIRKSQDKPIKKSNLYLAGGVAIEIGNQIGSGGEAIIYAIKNDTANVAKIFKVLPLASEKAEKIQAMVHNQPSNRYNNKAGVDRYITWPSKVIYDTNGIICGYIMRKLVNQKNLYSLITRRGAKNNNITLDWRIGISINLATIMDYLHAKGHIICDLNLKNVLISTTGRPTVIDTDSMQIKIKSIEGKQLTFRSGVTTEEYTPPELIGVDIEDLHQSQVHDLWRIAVVIYRCLLHAHPYEVPYYKVSTNKVDLTLEEKIQQGLWAHTPPHRTDLKIEKGVLNPDHRLYLELPSGFDALFQRAFQPRDSEIDRPSCKEWHKALSDWAEINQLNSSHNESDWNLVSKASHISKNSTAIRISQVRRQYKQLDGLLDKNILENIKKPPKTRFTVSWLQIDRRKHVIMQRVFYKPSQAFEYMNELNKNNIPHHCPSLGIRNQEILAMRSQSS